MTEKENSTTVGMGEATPEQAWTDGPEQKAVDSSIKQESEDKAESGTPAWERELIGRVSFAAITEQRRARRWGIFFKALGFAYVGFILYLYLPTHDTAGIAVGKRHTAVVEVNGVIAGDTEASADAIISGLRAAFKDSGTAGVVLRINSPGGSPVQAGYVNDEVKRLREKYPDIPLYAVITDICASGGYYIAAAADQIYADKASLVGSIGVLMNGFGFVDSMEKLGVERRLLTAGEHKGFLDPFSPLKESDVEHMRTVLESTHRQFIKIVREGRGDRLVENSKLFSGLVWTGEQGLEMGLVDALGSSSYVAREVVGEERIVDFTHKPNPLERFADRLGASFANVLATQLGLSQQPIR